MTFGWFARRAALIGTLGVLLGACVVVDPGPGPLPPRPGPGPDRPQACTFEYAPVCARRGRDERTFSNACMARADGYRIVDRGECRRPEPPRPGPGRPEFCTREYAPVCAVRGGRAETFPNACEARTDGYRVFSQGECRMSRPGRPGRPRG